MFRSESIQITFQRIIYYAPEPYEPHSVKGLSDTAVIHIPDILSDLLRDPSVLMEGIQLTQSPAVFQGFLILFYPVKSGFHGSLKLFIGHSCHSGYVIFHISPALLISMKPFKLIRYLSYLSILCIQPVAIISFCQLRDIAALSFHQVPGPDIIKVTTSLHQLREPSLHKVLRHGIFKCYRRSSRKGLIRADLRVFDTVSDILCFDTGLPYVYCRIREASPPQVLF